MIYIMYHFPCTDGFGSAYIARSYFMDAGYKPNELKFIPCAYQVDINELTYFDETNRKFNLNALTSLDEIYILDFSFKKETINQLLASHIKRLVILDHHKTAQQDLTEFAGNDLAKESLNVTNNNSKCYVKFDMDHSGVRLTYDYFYPPNGLNNSIPKLVDYIEDRDLWNWKLPNSKEVSAFISLHNLDFNEWDSTKLMNKLENKLDQCAEIGEYILRYKEQLINRIIENGAYRSIIVINESGDKVECDCVNSPIFQSEIGDRLCKKLKTIIIGHEIRDLPGDYLNRLALIYYVNKSGDFIFSLRSNKDNPDCIDVSQVAKLKGGGGHPNAAGFIVKAEKI